MTSTRRTEPQSAARSRNLAPIRVSALIAGDRRALRLLGDDNIGVRKHQAEEAPFKGGITLLAGGKEAALIPAAGSRGLGEAAWRGPGLVLLPVCHGGREKCKRANVHKHRGSK